MYQSLSGNRSRKSIIPREERGTMSNECKYIGKVTPRIDAEEMVTGKTAYIDDLHFPELLHGKVLRSPHPHAVIKRIHKEKAEALEGVKAVLTWQDIPDWKCGTPQIFRVLSRKVRYVGDAVALIAAETKEIAEKALELIEVEYEVLPAVFDIEEAIKPDAPQLYDEFPGNILPTNDPLYGPKAQTDIVMGDVEKGFEQADVIAEGTFGYQNIPNPIPAESPSAIARWEEPNKLTLWVSTQAVLIAKMVVSAAMGKKVDVRAIGAACGGEFRFKSNVLAGSALCHFVESGNRKNGKNDLQQRGTPGRVCPAAGVPYSCKSRHEK